MGLIDGREAKTDPFFVDIDITNRCNIRCVGCQYHSPYITGFSLETPGIQDISFSMVRLP
jgi:MoaA/NifB/PqqE/SkfB family radical SAM enzyme